MLPIKSTNELTVGTLIVNADDWGRDQASTDRTRDCTRAGSVSSVSAMVFMEDSARSAEIAKSDRIDAGLHLNLTTPFTASRVPTSLAEKQARLSSYLRRHRFAQAIFHPGLTNCFEYVVARQMEEFQRLYGEAPVRIDGHHHMHLCANVVFQNLLPQRTIVRRNFSFESGEKGLANRLYRNLVDHRLASRHFLTDYFFSLVPLEPEGRLAKICSIAARSVVEVETHPVNPVEHDFLTRGRFLPYVTKIGIAKRYAVNANLAPNWLT